MGGPLHLMVLGVAMMALGVGLGFTAGYYRGCANGACTY
jgi:hypothetical protein